MIHLLSIVTTYFRKTHIKSDHGIKTAVSNSIISNAEADEYQLMVILFMLVTESEHRQTEDTLPFPFRVVCLIESPNLRNKKICIKENNMKNSRQ